ncbi:hypothetical protein [Ferrimicrobium sp.]|uniref:hypothetical protein n=1 Tax=Ferrimicrobium sp. TaxID=2926050 RepID=UPI0026233473|nr:hypothetical protein [Ferrimicrobium sp.]
MIRSLTSSGDACSQQPDSKESITGEMPTPGRAGIQIVDGQPTMGSASFSY